MPQSNVRTVGHMKRCYLDSLTDQLLPDKVLRITVLEGIATSCRPRHGAFLRLGVSVCKHQLRLG